MWMNTTLNLYLHWLNVVLLYQSGGDKVQTLVCDVFGGWDGWMYIHVEGTLSTVGDEILRYIIEINTPRNFGGH